VGHDFFGHFEGHPHGELLADVILGRIDTLELNAGFHRVEKSVLQDWHTLLNAGLRIPLVGGSGKMDNLTALGCRRTYARLETGQEFTYKHWIEAVRKGRTFVTNGPILLFTVDGQDPGAALKLSAPGQTVRIRAEAKSLKPFERVEVVANGCVIAEAHARGSPAEAIVELEFPVQTPGWIAARCVGEYDGETLLDWIGAQTSPIYTEIEGAALRAEAGTVAPLFAALDQSKDWVATEANCPTDKHREQLISIFEAAKSELALRL
jgi:hypothetical protein